MCQNHSIFHDSIKLLTPRILIVAGLFLSLIIEQSLAAENWGLCRAPGFEYVDNKDPNRSTTEILADQMSKSDDRSILFNGQVELDRAGQRIRADELFIDNLTEQLRQMVA